MQGEWTPEREFVEAFEAWEAVAAPSCPYTTQCNPKACKGGTTPSPHALPERIFLKLVPLSAGLDPTIVLLALALVGKDIVFRFIIEYTVA